MGFNQRLVRSYDLRGTVGHELTEADARALGLAYAAQLATGARVAVAYDGRLSSPMLEAALVEGLVEGGLAVERVGRGPTGMLYFAVHERALAGGIMVTGSHNPADQNGFKLLIGTEPVFGEALRRLAVTPPEPATGGTQEAALVTDAYVDRLLLAAEGALALRVGWDAGNGATGDVLTAVAARLPGEHHIIHGAVDGRFPGHHPDPSVPANLTDLQALVAREGLDLGIAFDGDGDRIGVVDRTGAMIWPDELMLYLAEQILRDRPGAAVVADVKSSRVLFDGIAAAGGRPVLAPSGYVRVRAAMLGEEAPFAGEMSGHLFYADRWYGTDDALHVAMRLLAAYPRGGNLAAFRARLPATFATPELRFDCPDPRKAEVLAKIAGRATGEVDRTDGLRVTERDGWWLLRESGTEPKLTARVEAWSEAGREKLLNQLANFLADEGLELPTD